MIFGSIIGVLEFLLIFVCGFSVVNLICKTVHDCFIIKYSVNALKNEDFIKFCKDRDEKEKADD